MAEGPEPGHLYLLALPIGNRGDVTARVLEALRRVDVLAAEDTRRTRALLSVLGVERRLVSYHDHNESVRAAALVRELEAGRSVGLVSDAGTPLVSDPGYRLVEAALARGLPVHALPGPSAPMAALAVSGLPQSDVRLLGFLPRRAGPRRGRLEEAGAGPSTLVFFEAPGRLVAALEDALTVLGDRPVAVANDLTKVSERVHRGPLSRVLDTLRAQPALHGEFTVVLGPGEDFPPVGGPELSRLDRALARLGIGTRDRARVIAETFGLSRSEVYTGLLRSHGEEGGEEG